MPKPIRRKRSARTGKGTEEFTGHWHLQREGYQAPEEQARELGAVFEQHPHYRTSEKHERRVKQELYKVLLHAHVPQEQLTELAGRIMRALKRERND